ncbi:hypothetical protein ScPMuIL_003651 [Solemya velum]
MDEFRHTFVRLCHDNHIEPQDCVVTRLKSIEHQKNGKPVFDLSTNSLSAKICAVLGKVIATDRNFMECRFADSMLSEDAIKGLAHGFASNVYCKKLDLKGNNIRGTGTEALGKMLRHNKVLLSLCLEWNAMGMLDNSLAMFCEGLGANKALQALDLRNNQISHDGAVELAAALKQNHSLRSLDLRWNNVGLLGSRALLEMLQTNKCLCRLELAGNNIPTDVLKAIETAISQNEDRLMITDEHRKKQHVMTKHINQLQQDKALQLNELMDTIDQQEDLLRRSKRSTADKVSKLQEALEDRKAAFNSLNSKLAMTESELSLAEQKSNDYNVLLNKLKQEFSDQFSSHQAEMKKEKEDRAAIEMKLLRDLSTSTDQNIQLNTKVEDLERKCRQQQEQIFELKEQVTHLQAEMKIKGSQFDERIQLEKSRGKDSLRDAELMKKKELARVKQEAEETEIALRDRIQRLEMTRLELEEEISRLKTTNMTDKIHAEEQISLTKQKIKSEEESRMKQLEEKARVLQLTKDELQSWCDQQKSHVSEIQSKNSTLVLEIETYKRRVEEMSQELAQKDSITLAEVGKVKIDMSQLTIKLEGERQINSELRDKLNEVDRKMSEQMMRNRDILEEKEKQISALQSNLRARESEVSRIREEESQRAHVLQAAVMNYVSKVPSPR